MLVKAMHFIPHSGKTSHVCYYYKKACPVVFYHLNLSVLRALLHLKTWFSLNLLLGNLPTMSILGMVLEVIINSIEVTVFEELV